MEPFPSFDLTMEQQFSLRTIEDSLDKMSKAQLADMLLNMTRLYMLQTNITKVLARQAAAKL